MLFVLSAVLSYALGFFAFRELRKLGLIDQPNARSSHQQPTVRGGGVAVMKTIFLALGLIAFRRMDATTLVILCAAVMLAVVSFADDWKSMRASVRFLCHTLAAIAALFALRAAAPTLTISDELSWTLPPLLAFVVGFLWFAGHTNAFNFMDGINGLAAGQAVLTALGMVLVTGSATGKWNDTPTLAALAIGGAALGFLPHNFPKPRMFMGDVSSAPLGFLLAVVTVWMAHKNGWWLMIPLALLHANFVLDTAITLLRRIVRGERWYAPHREHFYQRLIRAGKKHTFVTTAEMAVQLVVILAMAAYVKADTAGRLGLIGAVLLLWAGFFTYAEILFNRSQRVVAVPADEPTEATASRWSRAPIDSTPERGRPARSGNSLRGRAKICTHPARVAPAARRAALRRPPNLHCGVRLETRAGIPSANQGCSARNK